MACKICFCESRFVTLPCCPRESVCPSCVTRWAKETSRPECPVCRTVWSIAESEDILGDSADEIVAPYVQSLIRTLAPYVSGPVDAYKKSKIQREHYHKLHRAMVRTQCSMRGSIMEKKKHIEECIKEMVPPIHPVIPIGDHTDFRHDRCLTAVYDHISDAARIYDERMDSMCYGYYRLWKEDMCQAQTYGKAVAYLHLERDIMHVVLETIQNYVSRGTKHAFGNVCKAVSLTKLLPEKVVARVHWSFLTACIHRINDTCFPGDKFPIFPHNTDKASCTCTCGLKRQKSQWISQCTSQCPQCHRIPGVVFYFVHVGCDTADAFRYASNAAELFIPKHEHPEVAGYIHELKQCHLEMNAISTTMNATLDAYERDINAILTSIEMLRQDYYRTPQQTSLPSHVDKPFFDVIRCSCSGIVDFTTDGVCSLCASKHCSSCWAVMDGQTHQCTAKENVAMIKDSSKQCPVCRCVIQRSVGCPVMFCTQCRSGFDYDTGKPITGLIDNPHYYDMLFSENAVPTVYPTSSLPSMADIHAFNDFTSDYNMQSSSKIVRRTVGKSIRLVLESGSIDSFMGRTSVLRMLAFECVLQYLCGDCDLDTIVNAYTLVHRMEMYIRDVHNIVSTFMRVDDRQKMLVLLEDAVALAARINVSALQDTVSTRITQLHAL